MVKQKKIWGDSGSSDRSTVKKKIDVTYGFEEAVNVGGKGRKANYLLGK